MEGPGRARQAGRGGAGEAVAGRHAPIRPNPGWEGQMPDELVEARTLVRRSQPGTSEVRSSWRWDGDRTGIRDPGLRQALDAPRRYRAWRGLVRHRMAGVKDALTVEASAAATPGLAARVGLLRERDGLLSRLAASAPWCWTVPTSRACAGSCRGWWSTSSATAGGSTTWSTTRSRWSSAAPSRPASSRPRRAPCFAEQRGRDSNPRLTSLPATAFKAVPIGHSGTPPGVAV